MLVARLGDDADIVRKLQRWGRVGARCSGDAMHRPGAALVLEGTVVRRMPVPCRKNRAFGFGECFDVLIDRADDAMAFGDRQATAGKKIILDVSDD